MKSRILYIWILCLDISRIFCEETKNTRVLCVDIGGTRIKAAILHPGITLEELRQISTIAFDSKEWLNENISQIFHPNTPHGLFNRIKDTYDEISIGVRGPVMDGMYCVVPKEHLPKEMKKECQKVAQCPVFLECDTGIWSHGALYWEQLMEEKIDFPCLGITLGTGVGVSLIFRESEIINIEISLLESAFQRLFTLTKNQPIKQEYDRLAPHDALGMPYFRWVQKEYPSWESQSIQKEFTERVIAFVQDMQAYVRHTWGVDIHSIMIGGGNSRYIISQDLKKAIEKSVVLLSPENMLKQGVSFDIISLLGCLKIREYPPVQMFPPWEEMLPWYNS